MMQHLKKWGETIDALGLRERLLFLVGTVAALFLLVDNLVLQPTIKKQSHSKDAIQHLQQQIALLEQETNHLKSDDANNPLQRRNHRITELKAQDVALDATIQKRLGTVVDTHRVAHMLRDIIAQESDLTLLELNTEVVGMDEATRQDVVNNNKDTPSKNSTTPKDNLEQYQLTLRLEGSYLATLRFLKNLEALPWALFSNELDLAVKQYPKAEVTLKLYTLGTRGGAV